MLIRKVLILPIKYIGKFITSKTGKKTMVAGAVIGAGLAGNGVRMVANAKKKNKKAYEIHQEALEKHDLALKDASNIIAELRKEVKESIGLVDLFVDLSEKIKKCPLITEIDLKIELPSITPTELKKISSDLNIALSGVGGGAVAGLPMLLLSGTSLSVLGFATLSGGVVLSMKGSKLSKQADWNIKQAKKEAVEVENIVSFYQKLSEASVKLTNSINLVNKIYRKKLISLKTLVKKNNEYEDYSRNEKTLVKNVFKLTILIANMCNTKLAKYEEEVEIVNEEEVEFIIKKTDLVCKETRQGIMERVFV